MSEYIKREDALDAVLFTLVGTGHQSNAIYAIRDIPTADVVEVVRCRDCVHWGGATYGFICRKFSGIDTKICMGADHYCSYGERREE